MHALDDFAEQDEEAQRDQNRRGEFGGEFDLLIRPGVTGLDHRLNEILPGNQARPFGQSPGQLRDHAVHDRIRPRLRLHGRDPAKEQRHCHLASLFPFILRAALPELSLQTPAAAQPTWFSSAAPVRMPARKQSIRRFSFGAWFASSKFA